MTNDLKTILNRAEREGWAVGHFNISNLEFLKAVAQAAAALKAPVIIGASEGERDFLGVNVLPKLVAVYGEAWGARLFLNADHTKSVKRAKEAIDAGFTSVHFDGSGLPLDDNIEQTKEVVRYARYKHPDISIEGEVGYLRGASARTQEKIKLNPEDYTQPEEAAQFVKETGVDRLAIAVGNVHGLNLEEPQLDFERIKQIQKSVGARAVLVLHAGSGIPDEDIRKALECGIADVHISTELREAWRQALASELTNPQEVVSAPYRVVGTAVAAIKEIVEGKIKLFGSENKI